MKLNSGQRLETPMGSEDENESQCSARGSRSEQQREGLKETQRGEVLGAKSDPAENRRLAGLG